MRSVGRVWGLLQKKLEFGKFALHRKEFRHKRIPLRLELLEDRIVPSNQPVTTNLALWLNADQGVNTSGSSVTGWTDQSGNGHNGTVKGSGLTLVTNAAQRQQCDPLLGQRRLWHSPARCFPPSSTPSLRW